MNKEINWDALKFQAVIAAMQTMIGKLFDVENYSAFAPSVAKFSVEYADALIAELKKEKKAEWSEEDKLFLSICKDALWKFQSSDKWDARIIGNWLEEKLKK